MTKHIAIPDDYPAKKFDGTISENPKSKMVEIEGGRVIQVPVINPRTGKPEMEPVMVKALDHYGDLIMEAAAVEKNRKFVVRAAQLQQGLFKALGDEENPGDRIWSMDDDHFSWLTKGTKDGKWRGLEEREIDNTIGGMNGLKFDEALLQPHPTRDEALKAREAMVKKSLPEEPEPEPEAAPEQTN